MWNESEIIRKWMSGRIGIGFIASLCLLLSPLLPVSAEAGVPTVANQRVTDLTTRSFSVILSVNEPSTTLLSLYAADCTTPASYSSITRQQNPLSGNTRVTVTGLDAGTSYCYQLEVTSAADSQIATTAAATLTTATAIERTVLSNAKIIPANNDIIKTPEVHLPAGESRDAIISTMELVNGTATSPLSLLLSSNPNNDYFNLNNVFAQATGKTHKIAGSERVKISEYHGNRGCIIERYRTLPVASGGTSPKTFVRATPADIDASGGVNILDVLRVVGGKGSSSNDPCFNSDLLLKNSGVVDLEDLTIIKGAFNGL